MKKFLKGRYSYHKIGRKLNGLILTVLASLSSAGIFQVPVFASGIDVSTVTKPINVLVSLVLAAVGGIGIIVLVLGAVDLFTSLGSHDTGGIKQGGFKMVSGAAMIGISAILALMGVSV
ncbi:MAG: hypothetical protein H2212_03560 [Ruminococcus sp.]|nr:hypothetical protein [Ruminococcus sp.]